MVSNIKIITINYNNYIITIILQQLYYNNYSNSNKLFITILITLSIKYKLITIIFII